jgi:hypothetical protein
MNALQLLSGRERRELAENARDPFIQPTSSHMRRTAPRSYLVINSCARYAIAVLRKMSKRRPRGNSAREAGEKRGTPRAMSAITRFPIVSRTDRARACARDQRGGLLRKAVARENRLAGNVSRRRSFIRLFSRRHAEEAC